MAALAHRDVKSCVRELICIPDLIENVNIENAGVGPRCALTVNRKFKI
jgi:hypothetical protein|tara:strand:+ start:267 stop:410 length:144 start_codon:yes stop_codon:yes gene_type:complete